MELPTTISHMPMSPLAICLMNAQGRMTWSMLVFLVVGNIGNALNCLVFLQKSLRSNPCSHYLFVSSIANALALMFNIPTSIYAVKQIDPISYSLTYCKLRLYIYHTLLMASRYLIVFACIDRACLSSRRVPVRNLSQIRLARLISLLTVIFWFLAAMHIPLATTIQSHVCIMPEGYALVFSVYAVVFAGLIPPIAMSVFSLFTIYNLHSMRVRVHAAHVPTQRVMHRRDFHLTRMLIAQVIIYIFTTTPYPLNTLYSAVTLSMTKSPDQQAIEAFIYFITGTFLVFINPSASFYIYIATSQAFRMELRTAWRKLWQQYVRNQPAASTIISSKMIRHNTPQSNEDFHGS